LKLSQFLTRALTESVSSTYSDPACILQDYYFLGTDEEGANGPADALEFCSSAPMTGGMSLPGMMKRVVVAIEGSSVSNQTLDNLETLDTQKDGGDEPWSMLRVVEQPLVLSDMMDGMDLDNASPQAGRKAQASGAEDMMDETTEFDMPTWQVPVHTIDITYFDGEEWVEEWDSMTMAKLPWSVRFRVNFGRTDEELEQDRADGLNLEEDPDFDLIVPVALGMGVMSEFMPEMVSFGPRTPVPNPNGQPASTDKPGTPGAKPQTQAKPANEQPKPQAGER
jgi:hypothetical protein